MMYGTTAHQYLMLAHGSQGDGNFAAESVAPASLEALLKSEGSGEDLPPQEEDLPSDISLEDYLRQFC